jgi:hypothetical protein
VRRRASDAGIATAVGCHAIRATGITEYLANDGHMGAGRCRFPALMFVVGPRRSVGSKGLKYGTKCYRMDLGATVRIFKSRWFQRFARKEWIADAVLREAVARAEKGQIDADLGGGVIKQRIARPGQGKSKGFRTIIFFRRGAKAFFVYGFSKSRRANIDDDEEEQFKEAAKYVLALTEAQLAVRLERGDFVEVKSA